MEMSVREARAQFAHALSAAERGERVTITKNGKAVAELGPPSPPAVEPEEDFWTRMMRVRKEMGLDKPSQDSRTADEWLADFNDPAATREMFGPDYYDYFDDPAPVVDTPR